MFLTFSDAAKFADIARNLVEGYGFGSNFRFLGTINTEQVRMFPYPATWTPPAMPYAIAAFFEIFGISDTSAIATSIFFFILTVIFTFLLGKKLFGKTVAVLSSLVVLINQNFVDYAKTGASETLFMFEIVAIPYLMLLKKRWATYLGFAFLVLMYFTRPQAFIFIMGYILFYLLLNLKPKKAIVSFLAVVVAGLLVDRFILSFLNGKYFLYSISGRGINAITQQSQSIAVSDTLRGVGQQSSSFILTIKKAGLNLFNFYRSLPQIANPYLFAFFVLSPLAFFKKKEERAFLVTVFFTAFLSFLLPALTIPFYRYIHPVLPLVYIAGTAALVSIVRMFIPKKNGKAYVPVVVSAFLVTVFVLLMQVGIYIHDYKYYQVRENYGKPPVYVLLSWLLRDNTKKEDVVLTNLDTWGSWYGERRTVWFPLQPKQIIDPATDKIPFDAIYLTSYLISDENYYMGEDWRQIFDNPTDPSKWVCDGCTRIATEFILKGLYEIPASDDFQKEDATAVLLIKKPSI
jgi:4-amino-4-deoxy-L-arabinose transferase-like glycosyltransferase